MIQLNRRLQVSFEAMICQAVENSCSLIKGKVIALRNIGGSNGYVVRNNADRGEVKESSIVAYPFSTSGRRGARTGQSQLVSLKVGSNVLCLRTHDSDKYYIVAYDKAVHIRIAAEDRDEDNDEGDKGTISLNATNIDSLAREQVRIVGRESSIVVNAMGVLFDALDGGIRLRNNNVNIRDIFTSIVNSFTSLNSAILTLAESVITLGAGALPPILAPEVVAVSGGDAGRGNEINAINNEAINLFIADD